MNLESTSDGPPPSPAAGAAARPVAVIDMGAAALRMAIAEISPTGEVRTLESLTQAISLGKDTFSRGLIERGTIEDCVRVLKSYRRKLEEYQITGPDQIRVVATSAVREAANRLAFLDRLYIATGLDVEPLDEAEVNRVTFHGVQPWLKAQPELATRALILEVGGGGSELLVIRDGDVVRSHTYRLGSVRLRQTLERFNAPTAKLPELMRVQVDRTVRDIQQAVAEAGLTTGDKPPTLIGLGGDVRFAAGQLLPDWTPQTAGVLAREQLSKFTDKMLRLSEDTLARRYHLSFAEAETVGPALLTHERLMRAMGLDKLVVVGANLRDGLLKEMAAKGAWTEEFTRQIMLSALDLGRKYGIDEAHGLHVARLARLLFGQFESEHKLPPRFGVLLAIAALLHEVGLYVGASSNHKHAMYLIQHSELFGLGKKDVLLTALIARYQRRASPAPNHEGYATLDREGRVAVAKLAALLRVAIALDESRSQRVQDLRCAVVKGRLEIVIPGVDDLSLEQVALNQNAALFDEVYGLTILLRSAPG